MKAIQKDGLIWTNHVSDLKFWHSEAAKTYGINSIPASFLIDANGIILAKIVVDFIAPLNLDDRTVAVYTKCSRIGSKSFDLSYVIVKTKSRAIAAKGITTMVCYNYKEKATILIPGEWIEKLKEN